MSKMFRCAWAGDVNDEYCKDCNGCTFMMDGVEKSCLDCKGYEKGKEEIDNPLDKTETPVVETKKPEPVVEPSNSGQIPWEEEKGTNYQEPVKTSEKPTETKSEKVVKVAEEKHIEEDKEFGLNGVQVVALRYTSSATVKKGDNYYKFSAEEEVSTALYTGDVQNVRDMLWAKLNSEVDAQIEELKNL